MGKMYLIEGEEKYVTLSGVIVRGFRIDVGAQGISEDETMVFKKGDIILGFRVVVTEAVASGGGASVTLGFTGKKMISAALAKATLVLGYVFGPDIANNLAQSYTLIADDGFDSKVITTALTDGKFEIEVAYIPAPDGNLDSNIIEYVTA